MRYEINDLLDEGQVEALTAEAFGEPVRKKRLWRRGMALAACAVLAVGVLNFGAIAAEAQKLWTYVSGVGAVEAERKITVQGEDIVWARDDHTYTLRGVYEKDGVLTLSLLLNTKEAEAGDTWFDIVLLEDGVPCQTIWGQDEERSVTALMTGTNWGYTDEKWGYVMPAAYHLEQGSFAVTSTSFYTNGSGHYTVQIWSEGAAGSGFKREGAPLTAELTLQTPESRSFQAHVLPQDGGQLTALVSEDGRRVSFYLDGAEQGLSLRCPYQVWFVDAAGARYQGAMVSGPAHLPAQSVEVRLEAEPKASIVSIEVGGLQLSKFDSDGRFLGYEERVSLDWTIPVA